MKEIHFFGNISDNSSINSSHEHICKKVLYEEIGYFRIRIWDLLLLIPVVSFIIGLIYKLNNAKLKLRTVHSPIYATFYFLIWLNTLVAVIRCLVSMTVNAATASGDEANIILYVALRFFLLATEMSVLVFGMFFGHLDNKTSIRKVLIVTSMIALPFSIVQSSLEFLAPDPDFYVREKDYHLFGHGGSLFWLISSMIFAIAYIVILLLRLNFFRRRFQFLYWMPQKRTFYFYLTFLAVLNILQSIGSGMYHTHNGVGLCLVDITTWTYFSLLTPSIYYTFLYPVFRKKNEQLDNITFSYKSDDEDLIVNTGFETQPCNVLNEEITPRNAPASAPINSLYSTMQTE